MKEQFLKKKKEEFQQIEQLIENLEISNIQEKNIEQTTVTTQDNETDNEKNTTTQQEEEDEEEFVIADNALQNTNNTDNTINTTINNQEVALEQKQEEIEIAQDIQDIIPMNTSGMIEPIETNETKESNTVTQQEQSIAEQQTQNDDQIKKPSNKVETGFPENQLQTQKIEQPPQLLQPPQQQQPQQASGMVAPSLDGILSGTLTAETQQTQMPGLQAPSLDGILSGTVQATENTGGLQAPDLGGILNGNIQDNSGGLQAPDIGGLLSGNIQPQQQGLQAPDLGGILSGNIGIQAPDLGGILTGTIQAPANNGLQAPDLGGILSGSSNTLQAPNLGGILSGNQQGGGLQAPDLGTLLGGGSGGLQAPDLGSLLGGGQPSGGGLQAPDLGNLLGGGSGGGLQAPDLGNLLGGGSSGGGLQAPDLGNLLGGSSGGGLQAPDLGNLLGGPSGGGLQAPNLGNLLGGGSSGGLKPPNIGGLGLQAPNLGGLLGAPGGLQAPNLNLGMPMPQMQPKPQVPKSNLKMVSIDKVQVQQGQQSIWNELNAIDGASIKFEEIEENFAKTAPKKAVAKPKVQEPAKPKKVDLIQDGNRGQGFMILMKKFKQHPPEELKQKLINMDTTFLTPDLADTLAQSLPQPEEVKRAKAYNGAYEDLDDGSVFIKVASEVPRFQFRLRYLSQLIDFPPAFKDISEKIELLKQGCNEMKSNQNFRVFLKISLELINKMNQGTARGGAAGFKLASYKQLMGIKSQKGNLNLFEYLLTQIYNQKKEVLFFYEKFSILNQISKIDISDQLVQINDMCGKFKILGNQLQMSEQDPKDQIFIDKFGKFYSDNIDKIEAIQKEAVNLSNQLTDLAKYFGETDETIKKKKITGFCSELLEINNYVQTFCNKQPKKK